MNTVSPLNPYPPDNPQGLLLEDEGSFKILPICNTHNMNPLWQNILNEWLP